MNYKFIRSAEEKRMGIIKEGYGNHNYFMTDVEKTIVDCFDLLQYSGGYAELIRAFSIVQQSCTDSGSFNAEWKLRLNIQQQEQLKLKDKPTGFSDIIKFWGADHPRNLAPPPVQRWLTIRNVENKGTVAENIRSL